MIVMIKDTIIKIKANMNPNHHFNHLMADHEIKVADYKIGLILDLLIIKNTINRKLRI